MPSIRTKDGLKHCYKCDNWFPITDFYKDTSKPDGLGNRCKQCAIAAHRTGNPSGRPLGKGKAAERRDGKKKCSICEQWLSESSFSPSKLAFDGLETRCKPCNVKRTSRRKTVDIKFALLTLAAYHNKNLVSGSKRRQQLVADSCVCTAVLCELWEEQDGKCAITGETMTHVAGKGRLSTNVSIDRIDSMAGYTRDNIQLVCWAVNQMKGQMDLDELKGWCRKILA